MAHFTPTQGRYLAFIHAYTSLHGYPPAESEIAAAMCVSPPSVNQMVKMLEKRGLILRRPGEPSAFRRGLDRQGRSISSHGRIRRRPGEPDRNHRLR